MYILYILVIVIVHFTLIDATSVQWKSCTFNLHDLFFCRFNGMDVPMSAHADGHTLTIISPQLSNAGNYTCFSMAGTPNEASFTFSLSVMPHPTAPTPSASPIPNDSPCSGQCDD